MYVMKQFDIPEFYRSPVIGKVKAIRKSADPRKKDFTPSVLDFGSVRFIIARHFGFCYGVENAIEIAYRAVDENPDKRIYLLSQMIHNPQVNQDLEDHGIRFIMDTEGNQFISWDDINGDDIVLIPAFGTTIEIENLLTKKGIEVQKYNTTCPFVEKVWNRSQKLGKDDYTIVIHGKPNHEETRATFSHGTENAPCVVIRNMEEAEHLAKYIDGSIDLETFKSDFKDRFSPGFDPKIHLTRIGVVNQTTMLANETQAIADYLKQTMITTYGQDDLKNHFADTRDTLCYATNDNQSATLNLLEESADLAIVVGGYNSSNTSHLVELLEAKFPTYFISSVDEIESKERINHFKYELKERWQTDDFLPSSNPTIILTSGASCPDAAVDKVMFKLLSFFEGSASPEQALDVLEQHFTA